VDVVEEEGDVAVVEEGVGVGHRGAECIAGWVERDVLSRKRNERGSGSPGMIEDLTITNYRSCRRLRVEGLTRVNLFVGRNNVGKTSLLDALDRYMQRATPEALGGASDRRRESRYIERNDPDASGSWHEGVLDLRLLIRGRELKLGVGLSIEGDGGSLGCAVEKGPNGQGMTASSVLSYRAVPELSGYEEGLTIPLAGTGLAWMPPSQKSPLRRCVEGSDDKFVVIELVARLPRASTAACRGTQGRSNAAGRCGSARRWEKT